ncbi:MAG: hypothetical protein WCK52_05150 [Betaproteobacteria bacterium]|jgi:hypothetical protein
MNIFRYKFWIGSFALIGLVACTATFNWREIRSDEQAFTAWFPAKTSKEQKTITIEGKSRTMVMEAATADKMLFAVGTMNLGQEKDISEKVLKWMKDGVQNSLKDGKISPEQECFFYLAGEKKQKLNAQGVRLSGFGPDHKYRIYWARWVARQDPSGINRIYQLSAIKMFNNEPRASELSELTEQYETFFSGFRPY